MTVTIILGLYTISVGTIYAEVLRQFLTQHPKMTQKATMSRPALAMKGALFVLAT